MLQRASLRVETFNTHLMPDETVLALKTARARETEEILDAVHRNLRVVPGLLQHVAIYAPRGFGKSFMTRLIQIETALLSTRERPIGYVLLPEEQHNLARNPHALLLYLAAQLRDARTGSNDSWRQSAFRWPRPEEEAELWARAVGELEQELDATLADSRGLVIAAVENFDTLLASVFRDEVAEQRLRQWLGREGNRLMLLATATRTADIDYERPLFQAFQSIRLEPWTQDDCIRYFNQRRDFEGRVTLDEREEAKARAIANFIGGNPRLAQLLGEVLDTEDALGVAATMNALADRLADYYRRRIDDLSPLAGGLVDALIRGGEPCSATELAQRVGAAQSDIARVMQDLHQADILLGTRAPEGRETLFRVIDRVFVHFYRLRQGEALARSSPLLTILEFLESFYTREEKRAQAARYLEAGQPAEASVFARLAGPERDGAGGIAYRYGFKFRLATYLKAAPGALAHSADHLIAQLEGDHPEELEQFFLRVSAPSPLEYAIRCAVRAQTRCRLGLRDEAKKLLQAARHAVGSDPDADVVLACELARFLDQECGERDASDGIYRELASVADSVVSPDFALFARLGEIYLLAKIHTEEAIARADRLIKSSDALKNAYVSAAAWTVKAYALEYREQSENAIKAADRAISLATDIGDKSRQATASALKAFSLNRLGRYAEGTEAADRAIAFCSEIGDNLQLSSAKRYKGRSLGETGRLVEAVSEFDAAFRFATQAGDRWEQMSALAESIPFRRQLGQDADALEWGLEALALAKALNEPASLTEISEDVVALATVVAQNEVVQVYTDWVDLWRQASTEKRKELQHPGFSLWPFFVSVMRAGAWQSFDDALLNRADRLGVLFSGPYWWRNSIADYLHLFDSAQAFAALRELLPRLSRIFATQPSFSVSMIWLSSLLEDIARSCRDPGLLRDIAGLIDDTLSPEAPALRALILALAAYDENPAVLARLDPDIATWVRAVRGIAEPQVPPPPKKPRSKRRR